MGAEKHKDKITFSTISNALFSGELLILLGVDKYLPHILVLFALGWVNIFMNYKIEQAMAEVEKNKVTLENYRIYHAQKTYQFVRMGRLSTVENMLEKAGSKVGTPEKPAETIKTR
jgi:hypothetical protein